MIVEDVLAWAVVILVCAIALAFLLPVLFAILDFLFGLLVILLLTVTWPIRLLYRRATQDRY